MEAIREEEFNRTLGRKILYLRKLHNISREALGCYLQVSGQQISKYESGESRISPAKLFMCTQYFGVEMNYFFDGDNYTYINVPDYDKTILTIARQLNQLPPNIRKSYFELVKVMNENIDKNTRE